MGGGTRSAYDLASEAAARLGISLTAAEFAELRASLLDKIASAAARP